MPRLWNEGKSLQVELKDLWPMRFTWKGHTHAVRQIYDHWKIDTGWWDDAKHISREYFELTTADGLLCAIYYDFLSESWYLAELYD